MRVNALIRVTVAVAAIAAFLAVPFAGNAAVEDEIRTRQQQIEDLQRQIAEYERQAAETRGQARTLETEVNALNAQVRQSELAIRALELSIGETSLQIQITEKKIADAEQKIKTHSDAIAQLIKLTNEADQKTLTHILLAEGNLSDFFNALNDIQVNQDQLTTTIQHMRGVKADQEEYQEDLEVTREELERSRGLEALEKRSLDQAKSSKDRILRETRGQETKFQELVKKSQQDIEAIRAQIYYLEQAGITAEEAVKFGQLAALRAGIRPSYLIAVLEVESGLGRNVGRCNRAEDPPERGYRNIMKPERDIEPFLEITAQLGLDPETTAVSCPQYVNGKRYGWGGAMGPAQFIPSTWMSYRAEVARLTGRSPANPWNIEDAFVAAAVKLARGGATGQTAASEIAASKAYYSGNSRCSTAPCNSYANAIQRKAAEIERSL